MLIGQIAAATSTIRVGSGAVQTGHQTTLSIVEQFGMLDGFFPGRIDLGLGRSAQRRKQAERRREGRPAERRPRREKREHRSSGRPRVVDGLLIPKPFYYAKLLGSSRLGRLLGSLQQPGAESPDYREQVEEILGLLDGTLVTPDGDAVIAVPGQGADVEVWIFGSSGGQSARWRASWVCRSRRTTTSARPPCSRRWTRTGPRSVRRTAWRSRTSRCRPTSSSAEDDATARISPRPTGSGSAASAPARGRCRSRRPEEAARHVWSDEDRELVRDRVDTQFVGSPATVADELETLAAATGADELRRHDHHPRPRRSGPEPRAAGRGVVRPIGQPLGGRSDRMSKPVKQIHLAAHFPGVNNTTVWSDPTSGSQIDFASFVHLAQTAERGKFDFFFLAEGLRLREHRGQIFDLDVVGRPDSLTVLAGAGRGHRPHRAGGHAQHHVQRALRAGPPVRHARPPQQRPGRPGTR